MMEPNASLMLGKSFTTKLYHSLQTIIHSNSKNNNLQFSPPRLGMELRPLHTLGMRSANCATSPAPDSARTFTTRNIPINRVPGAALFVGISTFDVQFCYIVIRSLWYITTLACPTGVGTQKWDYPRPLVLVSTLTLIGCLIFGQVILCALVAPLGKWL